MAPDPAQSSTAQLSRMPYYRPSSNLAAPVPLSDASGAVSVGVAGRLTAAGRDREPEIAILLSCAQWQCEKVSPPSAKLKRPVRRSLNCGASDGRVPPDTAARLLARAMIAKDFPFAKDFH